VLKLEKMVGFVVTTRPEEAKAFYSEKLGFRFVSDDDFAIVFDANGTMLRVVKAKSWTPQQGTVLGWQVNDIATYIRQFSAAGVEFQRYEFMHPDAQGIVTFPTGDKVAWFKDPDGNVLSFSQHV